jgi:diadenosine tetraphosphatase ApaH/serine/threonine PP2A family protein phosphatase
VAGRRGSGVGSYGVVGIGDRGSSPGPAPDLLFGTFHFVQALLGMSRGEQPRPQLSYVLAAMTSAEMNRAVAWLRSTPPAPGVEVVLAAPASLFARVAGRVIPEHVQLASAIRPVDRKAVRVAGAQVTTGLVVMVVDCDDDIAGKLRGPLGGSSASAGQFEDPATWVDPDPPYRVPLALPPGGQSTDRAEPSVS